MYIWLENKMQIINLKKPWWEPISRITRLSFWVLLDPAVWSNTWPSTFILPYSIVLNQVWIECQDSPPIPRTPPSAHQKCFPDECTALINDSGKWTSQNGEDSGGTASLLCAANEIIVVSSSKIKILKIGMADTTLTPHSSLRTLEIPGRRDNWTEKQVMRNRWFSIPKRDSLLNPN